MTVVAAFIIVTIVEICQGPRPDGGIELQKHGPSYIEIHKYKANWYKSMKCIVRTVVCLLG